MSITVCTMPECQTTAGCKCGCRHTPGAAPSREAIEARIRQIEAIRAKWPGNPGYLATLDVDLYALRLALGTHHAR